MKIQHHLAKQSECFLLLTIAKYLLLQNTSKYSFFHLGYDISNFAKDPGATKASIAQTFHLTYSFYHTAKMINDLFCYPCRSLLEDGLLMVILRYEKYNVATN